MRVHIIIHAPFEKPGVIGTWVIRNGHALSYTHTYRGEQLPEISEIDFLVIMGGPQSPLELDKYPYLRDEIALTKLAIDQKKSVLGICLGAQIIAESLDAKTERSPHKEVGVFPIHLTNEGINDPIFKNLPKSFNVMHWHNDMPGVPVGSTILAYSDGCPRQIIRFNERVYGLQCHMEMTDELITGMTEHCASDLKPSQYVQNAEKLLSTSMPEINEKMLRILNQLTIYLINPSENAVVMLTDTKVN